MVNDNHTRPGMVPHWSDLLEILLLPLGCWAVGIAVVVWWMTP